MFEYKYIYGPVPSRRLGLSLGVSPIPEKTCNYSCIYCQLGRTDKMANERAMFYDCAEIVNELRDYLKKSIHFDAITIVGEGEPTLYAGLGLLIESIKDLTDKPVVVITNGSLLYDSCVRNDLSKADIVMPSLDCFDEESFKKINRPWRKLNFEEVFNGLVKFSHEYKGKLWLEIMLVPDFNDSKEAIEKLKNLADKVKYDKLYINTPIRPPAESYAKEVSGDTMKYAVETLNGISIDKLVSSGFYSEIKDDYEAVKSIIKRHPMNQFELRAFIEGRNAQNADCIFMRINEDADIEKIEYKNYITYRIKRGIKHE